MYSSVCVCLHTTSSFIHLSVSRHLEFLPCLGYCKYCCSEHSGAFIFSNKWFSLFCAQKWKDSLGINVIVYKDPPVGVELGYCKAGGRLVWPGKYELDPSESILLCLPRLASIQKIQACQVPF